LSLAVWYKNHAALPIKVLNAHLEEFSLVPHSRVAHQDDNVAEKFERSRAPFAGYSSREQFPFRFIVKPKMSSMLLHQFDLRSVINHFPLVRFVQHSSQCSQSAICIRG